MTRASVTGESAAGRFHDVGPFPPWIRAAVEQSWRRTEAGATLRGGSARRPVGRGVCGCRPGVPFTPPHTMCYCCHGPGVRPNTPPSPFDPAYPGRGWGPTGDPIPRRFPGRGTDLPHSPPHLSRDECPCGVLCLCAIESRGDGRLALTASPPGGDDDVSSTPDRRLPHLPTVDPHPLGRLTHVDEGSYGPVADPYLHLEPSRLYEALHSTRRVCTCNPPRIREYHVRMRMGTYRSCPCVCGCPWRRGQYQPRWPWGCRLHGYRLRTGAAPEGPRACPQLP